MIRFFKITILLVLCGSCSMEQEYGITKIGEICKRDRNCIRNAFCPGQSTCLCDPYYSPSLDKALCIATAGLGCNEDSTCRSMANAECRQGVCACKETFILDVKNSSNCISRPTRVGDRCQRIDECQEAFDRAMCINEKCGCISGHHFANETAKCVQSRFMYYTCSMDYECVEPNNSNVLECKDGKCVCKEGESCSKGSFYAPAGISLILLQLLQRLF